MQLLRSKIVPATQDVFWQAPPDRWMALPPADMLVLAQPYEVETLEGTTLAKLIKACGMTEGKNAQVLMLGGVNDTSWHKLKARFSPKYVLMFGVLPGQLGISAQFALNTTNRFDGCIFIPTITPVMFAQDAAIKKQLWENALKPLFAIK